ncbi:hypothetical protein ACQRBN_05190 [Bariatricus sp. SGI.154]|uniref:hypothetical protein n=1 Tax=Bariatricus sp. SGI.154 TaxID=3420549 RepID=UPI003D0631FB
MTKARRKLAFFLAAITLITGLWAGLMTTHAQTTDYYFNLTVNTSDISKRTVKAGGSAYETIFYVTPTYFNRNIRYHAASFYLDTHSQYGVDITLTKAQTNQTVTGRYYITPPSNKYYYLYGTYDAAATSGSSLYVEGRFTP